ncbi:hypothetical protein ACF0H5_011350 [Mactra antiquata]
MSRLILIMCTVVVLITDSVQFDPFQEYYPKSKQNDDEPCISGKYAKMGQSGKIKCRHCSKCTKGKQIRKECGTHSDTECEDCPSGTFNKDRGGICRNCSECHPGTYIESHCTSTRDTKCRTCPKHRYNPVKNTEACEACSRCRPHEQFVDKCRKDRDTQCGECKSGYFRESFTGNCLPCSPCPYTDLSRHVVKACRTKLGIQDPNICWPGSYDKNKEDERISVILEATELGTHDDTPQDYSPKYIKIIVILIGVFAVVLLPVTLLIWWVCRRRFSSRRGDAIETNSFIIDMNEHTDPTIIFNRDSYIESEYTWPATTDDEMSFDMGQFGVDTITSHSDPTDLSSENGKRNYVGKTLSTRTTSTERKKNSRRKHKKRKQLEPPDVCYYTIPCNSQYYSQQLYVTM